MKKLLFSLFISFAAIINTAIAQEFDIRQVRWGMSRAELKSVEGIKPLEEHQEGIVYKVKFMGSDVLLTYFLIEDKTVAAAYVFMMDHEGKRINHGDYQKYMAAFGKIESMMTKKYGDSLPGENVIWTSPQIKEKNPSLKDAFHKGDVKFITSWETKYSEIKLGLTGGESSILTALYHSKDLQDLIKKDAQLSEKLALDDL